MSLLHAPAAARPHTATAIACAHVFNFPRSCTGMLIPFPMAARRRPETTNSRATTRPTIPLSVRERVRVRSLVRPEARAAVLADAAILAGMRFYAGYPMAPSTDLLEHLQLFADYLRRNIVGQPGDVSPGLSEAVYETRPHRVAECDHDDWGRAG